MFVNIRTNGPFAALTDLDEPSKFALAAINILFGLAGILSFIFLLWGGVQWIVAGGDKDAIEKGRRKIVQALIGLAIVFSAYAIIYIIRVLFQIDLLELRFQGIGTYQ